MTEKAEKKEEKKQVSVPILTQIQNEINVPKSHYSEYGSFSYRSVEDIEGALKPLLAKYGAQFRFTTIEPVVIGTRYYIKVVAKYKDAEQEFEASTMVREQESKKKMDDAQVTGATISYATKYLLGQIFLVDDMKDVDAMDNRDAQQSSYSNRGYSRGYSKQQQPARQQVPTPSPADLQRQAEEKLVNYQGLSIPLLTLYQEAKEDGKGSDTAKALHEISKGDAVIMNLVKQLVKAGV